MEFEAGSSAVRELCKGGTRRFEGGSRGGRGRFEGVQGRFEGGSSRVRERCESCLREVRGRLE